MSANEQASIVAELLRRGNQLWSTVRCDVTGDRYVIYAELSCVTAPPTIGGALTESKRVVTDVLQRRLGGRNWLATVHWSGRVSYTFAPD
jgi:hypothetical protein